MIKIVTTASKQQLEKPTDKVHEVKNKVSEQGCEKRKKKEKHRQAKPAATKAEFNQALNLDQNILNNKI